MGRIHLDSINEFARRGYYLRIVCGQCRHSRELHPLHLMRELSRRGLSMRVEVAERKLSCEKCRAKAARIEGVPVP